MALVIDVENDILYQRGREVERERAAQERLKMARKLKESGVSWAIIADSTGLSIEEIAKL